MKKLLLISALGFSMITPVFGQCSGGRCGMKTQRSNGRIMILRNFKAQKGYNTQKTQRSCSSCGR